MSMIKHILIDILDDPRDHLIKITERLSGVCLKIIERDTNKDKMVLHECNNGHVYMRIIQDRVLLVDIIGNESIFERVAKVLPIEGVIIRLVERGYPEE